MRRINLYNKFAEIVIDSKLNDVWTDMETPRKVIIKKMIKFVQNNYRRRKYNKKEK